MSNDSGAALAARLRRPTFDSSATQSPKHKQRVTIEDPEVVSPLMLAKAKNVSDDFRLDGSNAARRHSSNLTQRMSGRLGSFSSSDLTRQFSPKLTPSDLISSRASTSENDVQQDQMEEVLHQMTSWVATQRTQGASSSVDSLKQLESLLAKALGICAAQKTVRRKPSLMHRSSSTRKLRRQSSFALSSDTEYEDSSILVPSCETVLDNSKTLSYTDRTYASNSSLSIRKDREAWSTFKYEIVRLTHTLRLKGWRQISMERANDIHVERLSGALTNAVYVVTPPDAEAELASTTQQSESGAVAPRRLRKPAKLLLRIYGPQVEHLIDRDEELSILRRLARKRIGPRLLGCFTNGRFEEYFHARALKAQELRMPEVSKQIAKRMRELHDGIELLERERTAGPFVWQNWNKWVEQGERVADFIDGHAAARMNGAKVCGTSWSTFRKTVERYKKWLIEQYGGERRINDQLVFAHNDTQYGNILRLQPPGESPLLHPSNEHKQLVVIDFEYANANLPALEFANHFTEWCYDYHSSRSWACTASRYPSREEQSRFLLAYLSHRPTFAGPISTPRLGPVKAPSSTESVPTAASMRAGGGVVPAQPFDLDSFASCSALSENEKRNDAALEMEINRLLYETRLWRVANSAMWTLWGLVQARVPEMDGKTILEEPSGGDRRVTASPSPMTSAMSDPLDEEVKKSREDALSKRPEERDLDVQDTQGDSDDADHEEFDYLSYARDRAMFFWGDMLTLGLVDEKDLSADVIRDAKRVPR